MLPGGSGQPLFSRRPDSRPTTLPFRPPAGSASASCWAPAIPPRLAQVLWLGPFESRLTG